MQHAFVQTFYPRKYEIDRSRGIITRKLSEVWMLSRALCMPTVYTTVHVHTCTVPCTVYTTVHVHTCTVQCTVYTTVHVHTCTVPCTVYTLYIL